MEDGETQMTWIAAAQVYATLAVAALGKTAPFGTYGASAPMASAIDRYDTMHSAALFCLREADIDAEEKS